MNWIYRSLEKEERDLGCFGGEGLVGCIYESLVIEVVIRIKDGLSGFEVGNKRCLIYCFFNIMK